MRAGEIVEQGSRRAVFENPAHGYTRALMAAVPLPEPASRNRFNGFASRAIVEKRTPAHPAEQMSRSTPDDAGQAPNRLGTLRDERKL
jgi:ABC-type oligopeptide transport system ATPase subunit